MRDRQADKIETERIKKERKAAKIKIVTQRKATAQRMKLEADWQEQVGQAERRLYARLTGGKKLEMRQNTVADFETVDIKSEPDDSDSDSDVENPTFDDENEGSDIVVPDATPSDLALKRKPATIPQVTKETLLNPRSILNDSELEVLLFERGLARRAVAEPHAHVVARLVAADEDLSTTELNDLLAKEFDKGKGKRESKTRRLQELDANKSAAGSQGLRSDDPSFIEKYRKHIGEYSGLI